MTSLPESGGAHTPGMLQVLPPVKGNSKQPNLCTTAEIPTVIASVCGGHREANAARLALCWNSHDALVEALQAISDAWPAHGSGTQNAIADAMATRARAALAAAQVQL
jgi:hypothetical protein